MKTKLETLHDALSVAVESHDPKYPDAVEARSLHDAAAAILVELMACGAVRVEDRGTQDCYRVTRGGHKQAAPKNWTPCWDAEDEQD